MTDIDCGKALAVFGYTNIDTTGSSDRRACLSNAVRMLGKDATIDLVLYAKENGRSGFSQFLYDSDLKWLNIENIVEVNPVDIIEAGYNETDPIEKRHSLLRDLCTTVGQEPVLAGMYRLQFSKSSNAGLLLAVWQDMHVKSAWMPMEHSKESKNQEVVYSEENTDDIMSVQDAYDFLYEHSGYIESAFSHMLDMLKYGSHPEDINKLHEEFQTMLTTEKDPQHPAMETPRSRKVAGDVIRTSIATYNNIRNRVEVLRHIVSVYDEYVLEFCNEAVHRASEVLLM